MKYCKRCGVLYSSLLERCPKCNPAITEHTEPPAPEADKPTRLKQWIALCVGIPLMILVLYALGTLFLK